MVVLSELRVPMSREKSAKRTRNYRLYADTMQRLVEIAEYRGQSVAELVEPVLKRLADAEYMAVLNEKLETERRRRESEESPTERKVKK